MVFTFRKPKFQFAIASILILFVILACSHPAPLSLASTDVTAVLTSADKSHLLETQPNIIWRSEKYGLNPLIRVNSKVKFQSIVGFGAALTDGGASLLTEALSPEALNELWTELFHPDKGIGLSFMRMTIGASDLSPHLYSYEDEPGQFSIEHDLTKSPVIPLLLKAMKLNPSLQVMGSPWSPPAWMKDNRSMIKGSLAPEHQSDFANYLAKTVLAWQQQGLKVHSISMQNEPKNGNNFTTSLFNLYPGDQVKPLTQVDEQTFLAKYLGPVFERAGLKTKLLVWDHNYVQSGVNMIPEVLELLKEPTALRYSGGAAFHCYGDSPKATDISQLGLIQKTYPSQELYMSECSSGRWRSWADEFNYDADRWIIGPLRAGAKGILKWGLALDDHHEPYLKPYDGSCATCIGVVVVHNALGGGYTGKWSFERDYYILGQLSRFVRAGAIRIDSNESDDGVIKNVAFENPDGSKVLYVYNSSRKSRKFEVEFESRYFDFLLPRQSVVTFKWKAER